MSIADNQQETSPSSIRNFYYSGFCAGEMSCSIIKAIDKTGHTYYTPDFTVSNQDVTLLQDINRVIGQDKGVLSPVKGSYNLSLRGKDKVETALNFFDRFPIIAGDLANTRLHILREAMSYLGRKEDCPSSERIPVLERYRAQLRGLKRAKLHVRGFELPSVSDDAIGYFLAGVVDAEGSVGLRRRDRTYQPFFAVAMKDQKVVELLHDFLGYGYIYYRPSDGVYHYETGSFRNVLHAITLFTDVYPSKQGQMKMRMEKLRRILNDHTRDTKIIPIRYDGRLW